MGMTKVILNQTYFNQPSIRRMLAFIISASYAILTVISGEKKNKKAPTLIFVFNDT